MQYLNNLKPIALMLPIFTLSGTAYAHHSKAMFDESKCLTLAGTVRNFEWTYPHSWVWIVVPNSKSGAGDIWGFEGVSPSSLYQLDKRWVPASLKKGDKITVRFSPLKDGRNGGSFSTITLPDGSVLPGPPNACAGAAKPTDPKASKKTAN